MSTHFAVLDKLIQDNDIDGARIFNLDEASASPEKDVLNKDTTRRLMLQHGCQDSKVANILYKNRITVMAVSNATSEHVPSTCVLQGSSILYRVFIQDGEKVAESPSSSAFKCSISYS